MNSDVHEFIKMFEEKQSAYEAELAEIRNTYKKVIPAKDVVTPYVILYLRKEKKKLDRKWGEEGQISVEKAFGDGDASANLYYKTGNLTCTVYQNFKNGFGRTNVHRKVTDMLPGLDMSARLVHPYHEGDEIWARNSKDKTNWEILYRNDQTGKSTLKARTKNFCNLRTLEKTLNKLEAEWKVSSKGHKAIN